MKEEISRIEELIKKYQLVVMNTRKLKNLKLELFQEQEKLLLLKQQVDDEYHDIDRLEKKGLKQLFVNILVNREEQLKKERQEYLLAVLRLRESEKLIESLKEEMVALNSKTVDEELILKQIERQLEALDDTKLYNESIYLSELQVINKELQKLLRLDVEVKEAIQVSKTLYKNFIEMIKFLNRANNTDNWGKYYSEIQESKKNKAANVDKAEVYAQEIKRLVVFLKGEIEDVLEVRDEFRRTEAFIYEFNIAFYDHLLEDWIEDDNLAETLSGSLNGQAHILKMISSLEGLMSNGRKEYGLLLKKKQEIIKSLVAK